MRAVCRMVLKRSTMSGCSEATSCCSAASVFVELPVKVVVFRLLTVAGGSGEIGDAVGLVALRGGCSGDVGQGGEEVPERTDMVSGAAALDMSGPGHDEGHTDTALVEVALDAAETAVAVEVGRVGSALDVRSVVGGEDHNRIVTDAQAVQQGVDLTDLPVQDADHRCECRVAVFLRAVCRLAVAGTSVTAFVRLFRLQFSKKWLNLGLRQTQFGVRDDRSVHHEEGAVAVLADEVKSLLMYEVGGVVVLVRALIAFEYDLLGVVP